MSPFSGPVLGSAAVLSAPALWSSLVTGATPVDEGLLRYIGCVAVCWIGLSMLLALVGPVPAPTRTSDPAASPERDAR